MREPTEARADMLDRFAGFALRRVRALTMLVLIGAFGLILAHGGSWPSLLMSAAFAAAIGCGWLAVWFWVWVARNALRSRGGAK